MKKSEYISIIVFILLLSLFSFADSEEKFNILMFVLGLSFTIFGALLLFKKGFVEKMREGIWKSDEEYNPFTEKGGYSYDKYNRGIGYFIVGLITLAFSAYWLLA